MMVCHPPNLAIVVLCHVCFMSCTGCIRKHVHHIGVHCGEKHNRYNSSTCKGTFEIYRSFLVRNTKSPTVSMCGYIEGDMVTQSS